MSRDTDQHTYLALSQFQSYVFAVAIRVAKQMKIIGARQIQKSYKHSR